jgi:hypothetical protein
MITTNKIFIYGSKVDDFRLVDKDIIYVNAISAIKELTNICKNQQEIIDDLNLKINNIYKHLKLN